MVCKYYIELAKVRLTAMVLLTTAVGYVLGATRPFPGLEFDWCGLVWTLLGTGLAAVGAGTLNQIIEIDRDGRMERTRRRPLPSRAISRTHALLFAMLNLAAGLGVLNELVRPLAALLGLANVLIYTLVYTPLKARTPWCTPIGAICGALPPVMGWVGAGGGLRLEPALLAATMLLWQVPHSLSLVWMDRADYARAGYRMLPVVDPSGRLTTLTIALYWLALMPLGLVASFCRLAGFLFGAVSLLLGLVLFLLALRLRSAKTRQEARRVFLASVIYLPLLLLAMVADPPAHGPPRGKMSRGAVGQTTRQPSGLSYSTVRLLS